MRKTGAIVAMILVAALGLSACGSNSAAPAPESRTDAVVTEQSPEKSSAPATRTKTRSELCKEMGDGFLQIASEVDLESGDPNEQVLAEEKSADLVKSIAEQAPDQDFAAAANRLYEAKLELAEAKKKVSVDGDLSQKDALFEASDRDNEAYGELLSLCH